MIGEITEMRMAPRRGFYFALKWLGRKWAFNRWYKNQVLRQKMDTEDYEILKKYPDIGQLPKPLFEALKAGIEEKARIAMGEK